MYTVRIELIFHANGKLNKNAQVLMRVAIYRKGQQFEQE